MNLEKDDYTTQLQRDLTLKYLGTIGYNLQEIETFYHAQQTMQQNGMFSKDQKLDEDYTRFYAPINYCKVVNDEPVGYLGNAQVKITHKDERLEAWANDFYTRRIAPKIGDVVRWGSLYGECPLYFQTDDKGVEKRLKCEAIPLVQNGKQMVFYEYHPIDEDEILAAVIYRLVPTTSPTGESTFSLQRIWLLEDEFVIEEGTKGIATPRDEVSSWSHVETIKNNLGTLPVAQYTNPSSSDILDFMTIQKKLDKNETELDFTLEYQGFPMMSTSAPDATGLKVGAGNIFFGGDAKRIEAGDTAVLERRKDGLLQAGSKVARSLVLYREVTAAARSGDAEEQLKENLYNKLQEKTPRLASLIARALLVAAIMLHRDPLIYKAETRSLDEDKTPSRELLDGAEFFVEVEPSVPVDAEKNAKIASIWLNELGTSQETAFARAGIENPALEVSKAREEQKPEDPKPKPKGTQDDEDDIAAKEELDAISVNNDDE